MPSLRVLFTNTDQLITLKLVKLQVKVKEQKPNTIAVSKVKLKYQKKERLKEDCAIPGYSLPLTNLN